MERKARRMLGLVLLASLSISCATGSTGTPRVTQVSPVLATAPSMPGKMKGTVGPNGILAGVGSRRLTDRLASTYFIRSADPKGDYVMELVIFLKGEPGWTGRTTDWTFNTSDRVAFSNYKFFSGPFRAELDQVTGEARILDQRSLTAVANIFVVDGIGGPKLTVIYSEHQELRAPYSSNLMQEFVIRSPKLQQALGLVPAASGPSSK